MLKTFIVTCNNTLEDKEGRFEKGSTYKAYSIGNGFTVVAGEKRKGFCDMDKCLFRHGHPFGFQKYFTIVEEGFVQNKKELRIFLAEK